MYRTILFTVIAIGVLAGTVLSDSPKMISYQGLLTDNTGSPIDTTVSITFTIYDAATAGKIIWTENHNSVIVSEGLFSVILGAGSPPIPIEDSVFNQPDRYLGITVRGDPEISPRTQMLSVGYSHRVNTVDGASGGIISGDVSIQSDLTVSGKATIGPGHTNTGVNAFVAGENNTASHNQTTVGGGFGNAATGEHSTVGGGIFDTASGQISTVGGGGTNLASGSRSTVSGGGTNTASGDWTSVGGGRINVASAFAASVAGGDRNQANGNYSTVSGGILNLASGARTTISGGGANVASGNRATVGGGENNTASGDYSLVSGGVLNVSSGWRSTIGGGESDTAKAPFSGVASGFSNLAGDATTDTAAFVGGGYDNSATNRYSTIGGGRSNTASGYGATVGGGQENTASNQVATIAGGLLNTASAAAATVCGGSDNIASGSLSMVPGGQACEAAGFISFAAGRLAKANHNGSFVWADNNFVVFASSAVNQFNVRASGGTRIYSNSGLSAGVTLAAGASSWAVVSDSTLKRNIREVDYQDVLQKVAELPISQWSFKSQDENLEHIGPMAQDFYRLFGLGEDDKHINTLDPDGVALAAIKALNNENQELKKRLRKLEEKVERLTE